MPQRLLRRTALRAAMGAALGSGTLPAPASSQGLPARPVTVIVPYSAGSPPDIVARLLAEGLARRTGQPHVVDNRTGASGNIGTAAVARAAPDGTTLLVQTNTLAMNASLFRSLPYDPVTSFAPIVELATAGFGLLVHASVGRSVGDLLARAKASPGGLDYGSPGIGTPHHLAMELFRQQAGIELAHVPYRNLAGAVTDLLAGRVVAMFVSAGAAQGLAGENRVRLVAVASPARLPTFPEVPTLAELGLPATDMSGWYGLFAPAATPPETVARLNAAANEVLASPEIAAALSGQGITPVGGAPDRLRTLVAADTARWAEVVRTAGIVPE
ncbi:tripartite tricarboxylate transporter substrate binding protein [Roseomonas sp. KE2513]|uniref:Bug family tripartite tricarboxylate transporter substrate binding protein n=1 Tax=Roseomonas sp. KE2513 TaxID=2479202 RepID=UPI0018DF5276|nr:tripartite tricarboxylate transporter substrate binding protein [Roseomonas sp. KE2513]MBI0537847.1 tripartite tricarboxylate transporter substrate binding protein [Roseomonas sp. KE2513]